jgi:hypothetical protein
MTPWRLAVLPGAFVLESQMRARIAFLLGWSMKLESTSIAEKGFGMYRSYEKDGVTYLEDVAEMNGKEINGRFVVATEWDDEEGPYPRIKFHVDGIGDVGLGWMGKYGIVQNFEDYLTGSMECVGKGDPMYGVAMGAWRELNEYVGFTNDGIDYLATLDSDGTKNFKRAFDNYLNWKAAWHAGIIPKRSGMGIDYWGAERRPDCRVQRTNRSIQVQYAQGSMWGVGASDMFAQEAIGRSQLCELAGVNEDDPRDIELIRIKAEYDSDEMKWVLQGWDTRVFKEYGVLHYDDMKLGNNAVSGDVRVTNWADNETDIRFITDTNEFLLGQIEDGYLVPNFEKFSYATHYYIDVNANDVALCNSLVSRLMLDGYLQPDMALVKGAIKAIDPTYRPTLLAEPEKKVERVTGGVHDLDEDKFQAMVEAATAALEKIKAAGTSSGRGMTH